MLPKEHLSHSQINMYRRCPRQYYYRYIEDIVAPPNGNLVRGSAGHKALEYNFTQKTESHKDLKSSEVTEYFANDFERRTKEEEINWFDDKPNEIKDGGVRAIKKYQEEEANKIQPVEVEKKFTIGFDNVPYTLIGYIDLITDKTEIQDHKISGKTPSSVDPSQLVVYRMGYQAEFGQLPKDLSFNYLITTKTQTKIKNYPVEVSDDDVAEYLELVGDIVHGIENEVFWKNTTGWQCSPKYCGYFSKCRKHRLTFTDFCRKENDNNDGKKELIKTKAS